MDYSAYLVPLLLAFTAAFGMWKRVNVYDALSLGAKEGLDTLLGILPNLVGLMTAVYMLRASGLMDVLGGLLEPVLVRLGIPPETVMLGSTETTFYTVAVYFGSAGIRRTRYAIPAALIADLTGFMASAFAVRLLFGV